MKRELMKEYTPIWLMVFSLACLIFSRYDFYRYLYDLVIYLILFVFIWYMWIDSHKWGFIARKSLILLFVLNILNFVTEIQCKITDEYNCYPSYYDDFQALIMYSFLVIIVYGILKNKL